MKHMKSQLNKIEQKFASNLWQRGKEYYTEGLVGNVVKTGDEVTAESYGNSTYRLKINFDTMEMNCSCPCDFYCKHLAALVIWLHNNKPLDIDKEADSLNQKTKAELVGILRKILELKPEFKTYLQDLNDTALSDLIKKVWFPKDDDRISFFNKLDFIKENVAKKKKFDNIIFFLRKLIDLYDHEPETYGLLEYIDDYLSILSDINLTKTQKSEICVIIKDYPFEL